MFPKSPGLRPGAFMGSKRRAISRRTLDWHGNPSRPNAGLGFCSAGDPLELVDKQAAAELGLKPCALWRHDLAGIRHREEFVGARGVHREGDAARAGPPLEFGRAADASHKFDPGVGPRVADAEDWREHTVLEERDVEAGDRVGPVDRGGRKPERSP